MNIEKFVYRMLGVWTLALLGTGCTNDLHTEADAAALSIREVSVVENNSSTTRAGDTDLSGNLLKKGSIGVFKQNTTPGNIRFVYQGEGLPWATTSGNDILLTTSKIKLAAYYPYTEGMTSILEMKAQLYNEDKDICANAFEAHIETKESIIFLSHLYSRIRFRFVKQLTYVGDARVSKIVIKGLVSSATHDLFAKETTPVTFPANADTELILNPAEIASNENTADLLLIPASFDVVTAGKGLYFTCMIDNNVYFGNIPAKLFRGEKGLEAGYQYTLDILLGEGAIEVRPATGVVANGWKSGNDIVSDDIVLD